MIEVQLVCRTANYALASVPSPASQLHRGWDYPSPIGMSSRRSSMIFLPFYGDELKLEYLPGAVVFLPGVNEVEDAVVRPYALPQLLVYPHAFRGPLPILMLLGGPMEPSVLGEGAVGGALGLFLRPWVGTPTHYAARRGLRR